MSRRGFGSDNYAGVLPAVMRALQGAGEVTAHAGPYGGDPITPRLQALVQRHFGPSAVAFPVFNGTAANVLSLLAACPRHASAVLCAESAHVHNDEGGAPEMQGLKLHLLPCPGGDGKLTPEAVRAALFDRDSVHRAQPGVVSISNTTELGTVYSPAEVRALAGEAHAAGLMLHLDGARISNAAAALGCAFRDFTTDAGVDIVSFGGTKIGAMGAEAVVVLNPALHASLPFLRKTAMQLASKQRFISAQLCALLEPDGGLPPGEVQVAPTGPPFTPHCVTVATHANAMAARLIAALRTMRGVRLPVDEARAAAGAGAAPATPTANAAFPVLPPAVTARLRAEGWRFYDWPEAPAQVRLMAAWDTSVEDVDEFVAAVQAALEAEEGAAA